jgi:CRP/FNR family cyclic AMP-dependent transcriptional regulator
LRACGHGPFVREGQVESASLYIIEDGSVEITRWQSKTRVKLATLGPGQYFGELAIIDGAPRSATATATTPVHVLILHRQEFIDFIHRDPVSKRDRVTTASPQSADEC